MFALPLFFLLAASPVGDSAGSITDDLLAIADEAKSVARLDLPGPRETKRRLDQLVRLARPKRAGQNPMVKIARLNDLIFTKSHFRRWLEREAILPMLLPSVLAKREGTCLGLAGLYLALGERLGLPLFGVLAPGHFFVRFDDGQTIIDIELLKEGRAMPATWYAEKYAVPKGNPLYLRSLTARETLAVFHYNLANLYRDQGEHPSAIECYTRVAAVLPDFAEAHANLGLLYQLRGQTDLAKAAYQRAFAANPDLPGLRHNMEVLRIQP